MSTSSPVIAEAVMVPSNAPTATSFRRGARTCANCATQNTPVWRRGPEKQSLCNACGLYLKTHKKQRDLSRCYRTPPPRLIESAPAFSKFPYPQQTNNGRVPSPKFPPSQPRSATHPSGQHELPPLPSISAFESAHSVHPYHPPENIRYSQNVPPSHNIPGWQPQFEPSYFPPHYAPSGPYDNLGTPGYPGDEALNSNSPSNPHQQHNPFGHPMTHHHHHDQHHRSLSASAYSPSTTHDGMATTMADRSADYRQLRYPVDPISAWSSGSPTVSDEHTPTPPAEFRSVVSTPLSSRFDGLGADDISKSDSYNSPYRNC